MAVTDSATALPTVEAEMNFTVRSAEKPKVIMSVDQTVPNKRTGEYALTRVPVADARALSQPPQLDREGFELINSRTMVADFYDEQQIKEVYYPEVIALLKAQTGASDVHIFDHTLRVQDADKRSEQGTRLPVPIVHNDYTDYSGPLRAAEAGGAEAQSAIAENRYMIVNVWRPINGPIEQKPLAVCDVSTMAAEDFVPAEVKFPTGRTGYVLSVKHRPTHRWLYFPGMDVDEAMVFRTFDPRRSGADRYGAHCSFDDPTTPAKPRVRESIEVRVLALFAD